MKTIKQNKLITFIVTALMFVCAIFGAAAPTLAKADSTAFDWSKYDDPANYTETIVAENDTLTLENKVIRIKRETDQGTRIQFNYADDKVLIIGLEMTGAETAPDYPVLSLSENYVQSNDTWQNASALHVETEDTGVYYRVTEDYTEIYISANAYLNINNASMSSPLTGVQATDASTWQKETIPTGECEFMGIVLKPIEVNSEVTKEDKACTVSILELKNTNPGTGSGGSSLPDNNNNVKEDSDKLDAATTISMILLLAAELFLMITLAVKLPNNGKKWLYLFVLLCIFTCVDLYAYASFIGII